MQKPEPTKTKDIGAIYCTMYCTDNWTSRENILYSIQITTYRTITKQKYLFF